MRKEGLKKDNRNGIVDDAESASTGGDPIAGNADGGKQVNGKNGEEDPLSVDQIDPFDALAADGTDDDDKAESIIPGIWYSIRSNSINLNSDDYSIVV